MKRPLLIPLVPLYAVGARVKNWLYDLGWLRARRLARPVISVGSLSAGGAGKTPLVLLLADLLARHGVAVDVLSRGYGRGSGVVERVDPDGLAARFGDEPVEMARKGVSVWVGADRWAAGVAAEESGRALLDAHLSDDEAVAKMGHMNQTAEHMTSTQAAHLMDDGFQHRRLARSLDIVMLTAEDTRDWLLPAGNLREHLAALGRADVVVVRDDEWTTLSEIDPHGVRAEVWRIRRHLELPSTRPRKPIAFCGIARPQSFFAMLRGTGCVPAGEIAFADHYAYEAMDMVHLAAAARHAGADGFVTTAKDAVKLTPQMLAELEEAGPVVVAELRLQIADEARVWERLRQVLERK